MDLTVRIFVTLVLCLVSETKGQDASSQKFGRAYNGDLLDAIHGQDCVGTNGTWWRMWGKQVIQPLGSHALQADNGHHCVDDGGKVQGEPNKSVDPTHLDGRSE